MEATTNQMVHVSKEFSVPVNELYRAWVEPEALKQWWSPMGHKLQDVKNDLKAGGNIEYRFSGNNEETSLVITGSYEEVLENSRLVYSWNWQFPKNPIEDSSYKLTIEFSDQGNGSKLDVRQENLKNEEAIKVHEEGWDKSLNDLQRYLTS